MNRWVGRVALVTGASRGIGAAIAETLVNNGMVVVGCARHGEEMEKMANELQRKCGSLIPVQCDITKADERKSMFKMIKERVGGVDVCVNNAGVNLANTGCSSGSMERFNKMLNLNVMGAVGISQLAIESMRERGMNEGHIINISSICGHVVHEAAFLHQYAVTKHALNAFVESLRHELRISKSKIRTTVISPCLVDTPQTRKSIYWKDCSFSPEVLLQADDIADAVIYALSVPSCVNVRQINLSAIHDPY